MAPFRNDMPLCPASRHCARWAMEYMQYCLCSARDGISLSLGVVSVISWGVAEIPQIVTNYKQKSAEGLSIAFLMTWVLGDFFNLFGCMLEPATLPTQYYMAVLYTVTTMVLAGQTVYYGHIYPRLKCRQPFCKGPKPNQIESAGNDRQIIGKVSGKEANSSERQTVLSSPIPLPALPTNASPGKGLYYVSARSLSSSYTPTAGSFFPLRMSPNNADNQGTIEEPLLAGDLSEQSAPSPKTKNMLCLVSAVTFFGTFNLPKPVKDRASSVSKKHSRRVMQVGRKLLQVNDGNGFAGNSGVGSFLGWAMAAIYMGGRLPQICLNIRRGNVEGLNPLMFLFALIGNITYVASILVSSLDWSKIRPNLPWLVDATGCVLLDILILIQFVYFTYWRKQDVKITRGDSGAVLR
ncbi:probable vacuolar amino acid transporter YPQ1 [Rhodamnia argentea]|uniref:Probable vacuolar amino acid transporter YPQ1 n=1 Tax=Rhodamnia argentea TaxID=178133 RepID=A0A8B8NCN8_9MYRT|nr:probable vacuolar amino acid transporter YPQ1 [Rhodamnia argentea]XP_030520221.2 probable vacuolar amino acid transporter YPQ1 [Rhodamnia argentea]XP_048127700.1 probable vacuolar amino acid transporter YPQ1 [Rhodamnia argentea]